MAIKKVSRLQHRRGLKSDLPVKLFEGEIGFCLDTRELFIGNSDAETDNSQILTQWTPNDKLINHAYYGYTGVPAASAPRSIGAKLDDFVSVRDYGAVGNGVADDYDAIQRAITDRYAKLVANGYSPLSGYVTIWLPAGTYRITQALSLYPYLRLQGEGADRTQITLDNPLVTILAQTVDSDGNTGASVGSNLTATLPQGIEISDIWFNQPNILSDGLVIVRASDITIKNVKITGPWTVGSAATTSAGVKIQSLGGIIIPDNLLIEGCEVSGMSYAVISNDPITNLKINLCNFHDCYQGVALGPSAYLGGPSMTKVVNSTFSTIDSYGLACWSTNPGVVSTGNNFDLVGASKYVSPIFWGPGTNQCASLGDQFVANASNVSVITNQNPSLNVVFTPRKVSAVVNTIDLIGPITLADNHPVTPQTTAIGYDISVYNNILIDYSLTRATNKRLGRLTILTDGTNAVLQDEFTTLGSDLGVTFSYVISGGTLTIFYTTTNTGSNAVMHYMESKWFS